MAYTSRQRRRDLVKALEASLGLVADAGKDDAGKDDAGSGDGGKEGALTFGTLSTGSTGSTDADEERSMTDTEVGKVSVDTGGDRVSFPGSASIGLDVEEAREEAGIASARLSTSHSSSSNELAGNGSTGVENDSASDSSSSGDAGSRNIRSSSESNMEVASLRPITGHGTIVPTSACQDSDDSSNSIRAGEGTRHAIQDDDGSKEMDHSSSCESNDLCTGVGLSSYGGSDVGSSSTSQAVQAAHKPESTADSAPQQAASQQQGMMHVRLPITSSAPPVIRSSNGATTHLTSSQHGHASPAPPIINSSKLRHTRRAEAIPQQGHGEQR